MMVIRHIAGFQLDVCAAPIGNEVAHRNVVCVRAHPYGSKKSYKVAHCHGDGLLHGAFCCQASLKMRVIRHTAGFQLDMRAAPICNEVARIETLYVGAHPYGLKKSYKVAHCHGDGLLHRAF